MADLEDIHEGYGRNIIIFDPGQKKGKRGTQKRVNLGLCQKSSEILKIKFFTKIQI